MAVFDKGDIVRVCLEPVVGNEQQGEFRPCLVLSPRSFNKLGLTLVAPISQGGNFARVQGFTVTLMGTGTQTQGVVLVNGIRNLDLSVRNAAKVEKAPQSVVDEAVAILEAILNG